MASSYGPGFACFVLLVAVAGATQFKVGGEKGWSVPDANAESYNTWAMKNRFQIGDQLLFVYPTDKDSVLLVEPRDYNTCNTSSYVRKFNDGSTVFTFDRSGTFFFISGKEDNCRSNEKLIVMVLANSNSSTPAPSSSPPATPSPSAPLTPISPGLAPPTSPAPESPPSPTPSSTAGAAPPPAGSVPSAGGNATTSGPPLAANNDKNGAALTVAGLISSFGACIGYAMLAL